MYLDAWYTNEAIETIHMNREIKQIYFVITIFALLVLAGFYGVMASISDVRTSITNNELQRAVNQLNSPVVNQQNPPVLSDNTSHSTAPTPQPAPAPQPEKPPADGSVTIPTTISFTADSSPRLQPLVPIAVTVDSVKKAADGSVTVAISTTASSALGYSAFEVPRHFEIIDFETGSEHPSEVKGGFDSIPPKTRVSGTVLFAPQEKRGTIILQIGAGSNAVFYEFDFIKKTYRETVIG